MAGKRSGKGTRALAPIGDYDVGYGKPPVEHQYKKDQPSPNPNGRPRKPKPPSAMQLGWTNGFHDMTLEEAMRPVQMRDGKKVVTIPAYQAATRAAFVKAGNGNAAAHRNILTAVNMAQEIARKEKEEAFTAAQCYKLEHTAYARRCDEQGIDHGLEIHPDDIDFDLAAGEVIIRGPLTPEQRAAYKMFKDGAKAASTLLVDACEELRANPRRKSLKDRIAGLAELIAKCNEVLPPRDRVDVQALLDKEGLG